MMTENGRSLSPEHMDGPKTIEAYTINEWRAWLRKNHKREDTVMLIRHKKHTDKPTFNNKAAMAEAICFGWIDTTIKRLDDHRYGQTYRKRTKNSRWSTNTISYAKQLIKDKRMTKEGLRAYEAGRRKPVYDSNLLKDAPVPKDLRLALSKNRKAREFFDILAPSYRRIYIVWVHRAVRPETRQKRIKTVIENCRAGKKFGE